MKSPEAFRTIGEAAEEIGVPHHVLRFWETRFEQLQPLKRGGNRRYYRPADMDLLRAIHRMLHAEGLTIRGAQRVLAEGVPATPAPEAVATAPVALEIMRSEPDAPIPANIDIAKLRAIRDRLAAALAA